MDGYRVTWETKHMNERFEDCFDLSKDVNWYGGPQRHQQDWPLENMKIESYAPYVPRRWDNFAVCERYWLNSKGAFIYVKEDVPLYVDQNDKRLHQVCFIAAATGPYIGRSRVSILE